MVQGTSKSLFYAAPTILILVESELHHCKTGPLPSYGLNRSSRALGCGHRMPKKQDMPEYDPYGPIAVQLGDIDTRDYQARVLAEKHQTP